jgi:glycosyltransferase involved in cell wall biosynthesis
MRVLLIADWMRGTGGAESYLTWVRDGLRAAGDDVRLLTSSAGSAADGTADYVAYGTNRPAAQAALQIVNPFALATLGTALRALRPDVAFVTLFMYHLSPAVLARLRGVPTVLSVVDYKCVCPLGSKMLPDGRRCTEPAGLTCVRHRCVSPPHWLRDLPRYALVRSGLRQVDRVLACSEWLRRELERNGIPAGHVSLPVPAPGVGFRRAPAAAPLFLYCGRLEREKGVVLLVRAFARVHRLVPTARLRIAGHGSERAMLEGLVKELGIGDAVAFRGWVPPEEVEAELAGAWALVAPSLWAEPLGLTAREAIVRGVPVVASADGGLAETVEHGVTGLLFPNGDETALAERLDAIASGRAFPDRRLPEDIVRQARESYDVGRHVASLRRIFEQLREPACHTPARS